MEEEQGKADEEGPEEGPAVPAPAQRARFIEQRGAEEEDQNEQHGRLCKAHVGEEIVLAEALLLCRVNEDPPSPSQQAQPGHLPSGPPDGEQDQGDPAGPGAVEVGELGEEDLLFPDNDAPAEVDRVRDAEERRDYEQGGKGGADRAESVGGESAAGLRHHPRDAGLHAGTLSGQRSSRATAGGYLPHEAVVA